MKTILQHSVFRTTFILLLLVAVLGLTPTIASAESTHPHQTALANSVSAQNDCPTVTSQVYQDTVVIVTDYGRDVDCFWNAGTKNVGLDAVTAIETHAYDLTFTWIGIDGSTHTSFKSSYSFLSAGNASPNYFAGAGQISEITSISLSYDPLTPSGSSCSSPSGAVWIATHANGATNYYALCFTSPGTHSVLLYGVYAIETGSWNIGYAWIDHYGKTGSGSAGFRSMIAPGSAVPEQGFADVPAIEVITSITLFQG